MNASGFSSTFSVLEDKIDMAQYQYIAYAEKPEFRLAVHAGNLTYSFVSTEVQQALEHEFMTSKSRHVEEILRASEEYKVIIVSAQMDISVPHRGVDALVDAFVWEGSEEIKKAPRNIWKVDNTVAGYVRSTAKLVHVFMRNAGHMLLSDQPEWNLELVLQCLSGDCFQTPQ